MKHQGFTMLEMLVVISIAALLLVLIVPSLTGSARESRHIREAANIIENEVRIARTISLTRGIVTEIRFYRLSKEEDFKYIQIFYQNKDFSFFPEDRVKKLGNHIIISEARIEGESLSSLTEIPIQKSQIIKSLSRKIPPDYFSFRFLPNGTTNLRKRRDWTLTLEKKRKSSQNSLPKNFITLALDPLDGEMRRYSLGK